jgi:hypothetical protein
MKKTKEDRRFAARFAEELRPHIDRELAAGQSMAKIAAKLGVTAWGLQKQLNGGTPSIRTVSLAYSVYKVAVPYGGVDITKALNRRRRTKKDIDEQLVLPFEIDAPARIRDMTLKMSPKGIRRYRLNVVLRVG